jgi:hypothetical protein
VPESRHSSQQHQASALDPSGRASSRIIATYIPPARQTLSTISATIPDGGIELHDIPRCVFGQRPRLLPAAMRRCWPNWSEGHARLPPVSSATRSVTRRPDARGRRVTYNSRRGLQSPEAWWWPRRQQLKFLLPDQLIALTLERIESIALPCFVRSSSLPQSVSRTTRSLPPGNIMKSTVVGSPL